MTKYCIDSNYGTVDNKNVLDLEDDVANVKWGGSWRMPTNADFNELFSNCTWSWSALNGVSGYTVTGPNGNSIFLPAAGNRVGTDVGGGGGDGFYWTSSLLAGGSRYAYYLYFSGSYYGDSGSCHRFRGLSVRPVSK